MTTSSPAPGSRIRHHLPKFAEGLGRRDTGLAHGLDAAKPNWRLTPAGAETGSGSYHSSRRQKPERFPSCGILRNWFTPPPFLADRILS
jgi:hypothetical protein